MFFFFKKTNGDLVCGGHHNDLGFSPLLRKKGDD